MSILDRLDEVDRKMGLDGVVHYVPWIIGATMGGSVVLSALSGDWARVGLGLVALPMAVWRTRRCVRRSETRGSN